MRFRKLAEIRDFVSLDNPRSLGIFVLHTSIQCSQCMDIAKLAKRDGILSWLSGSMFVRDKMAISGTTRPGSSQWNMCQGDLVFPVCFLRITVLKCKDADLAIRIGKDLESEFYKSVYYHYLVRQRCEFSLCSHYRQTVRCLSMWNYSIVIYLKLR